MRKEIIFAIIFGSILGLVVAFGIWRVNSALTPKDKGGEAIASPIAKPEFLISLAKPENNDVVTALPLEINGLTKSGALVAASAEEEDYLTNANDQGVFNESVNLVGGVNQILLTAFDETGNSVATRVLVVYSSEFKKIIENLPTPAPATSEADSVRAKVEKKVEETLNKAKAYLGTVADISETTIQIKSAGGDIHQVSTAGDTAYIKSDPTVKVVGFKDLAIGDFIVAMGFRNGNAVLNAKRILIISPLEAPKEEVLLGKVSSLTKKDFVLTPSNDQPPLTITPTKKIAKAKLADLEEGTRVVVFGERGEKTFAARTVFVIY